MPRSPDIELSCANAEAFNASITALRTTALQKYLAGEPFLLAAIQDRDGKPAHYVLIATANLDVVAVGDSLDKPMIIIDQMRTVDLISQGKVRIAQERNAPLINAVGSFLAGNRAQLAVNVLGDYPSLAKDRGDRDFNITLDTEAVAIEAPLRPAAQEADVEVACVNLNPVQRTAVADMVFSTAQLYGEAARQDKVRTSVTNKLSDEYVASFDAYAEHHEIYSNWDKHSKDPLKWGEVDYLPKSPAHDPVWHQANETVFTQVKALENPLKDEFAGLKDELYGKPDHALDSEKVLQGKLDVVNALISGSPNYADANDHKYQSLRLACVQQFEQAAKDVGKEIFDQYCRQHADEIKGLEPAAVQRNAFKAEPRLEQLQAGVKRARGISMSLAKSYRENPTPDARQRRR